MHSLGCLLASTVDDAGALVAGTAVEGLLGSGVRAISNR